MPDPKGAKLLKTQLSEFPNPGHLKHLFKGKRHLWNN